MPPVAMMSVRPVEMLAVMLAAALMVGYSIVRARITDLRGGGGAATT